MHGPERIKLFTSNRYTSKKNQKKKENLLKKEINIKNNISNSLIFIFPLQLLILLIFYYFYKSLKKENQKLKQIIGNDSFKQYSEIKTLDFNLENLLLTKIKEKYEKEGFININEIESSIHKGRHWEKQINKEKEVNVGAAFDERYILRSMFTIASIMDSQKNETKLRLHFAVVDGFSEENMLKVYKLRERIREDVEFNFYNANRSEIDFQGVHTKGNSVCARLLLPELVPDDVDRLIILDTGDAMVLRDLSGMYNWDMKDKLYSGVIDGRINSLGKVSKRPMDIYINSGNYLIDVKKVKAEKMYEKFTKYKDAYRGSVIADQELLNDVAFGQISYMPMRFGLISPYRSDEDSDNPNCKSGYQYVERARHKEETPFLPKSRVEVTLKAFNPVIIHQWNGKWMEKDYQYIEELHNII